MKFYSQFVMDMETCAIISETPYEYSGLVEACKGATKEEKSLQASQAKFYNTLQGNYGAMFAGQQGIISAMKAAYDPIIKAGINQYGFNPAEDAALRTQASDATARQYTNAKIATNEELASRGGGNAFLPSGAADELNANIDTAAAAQESSQELDITKAGYAQGRQNFLAASSGETGLAELENPNQGASVANTSGSDAFSSAAEIQKQDAAASPWGVVGGILGGAADAFSGGLLGGAGGLGAKVAKNI